MTGKVTNSPKAKVTLTVKAIRAVVVFGNAKRAIKKAEERKARAEVVIREALGDAGIGLNSEGLSIVEVMYRTRTGYSPAILRERFPEAEKAAKTSTPYNYLDVL